MVRIRHRVVALALVGALMPARAMAQAEPPAPIAGTEVATAVAPVIEAPTAEAPASAPPIEATEVVPNAPGTQAKITTTTTTTVDLGVAGRAAGSSATAPAAGRRIWIESDSTGVTLNRYDGGGRSGVVCHDACGEIVDDRDHPVYVDGDRILPSAKIKLPRGRNELILQVRGNLPLFISGMTLVGLGGVSLGFGVAELSWAAYDESGYERKLGIALVSAGAAAIVVGLVLGVLGRTRVRVRAR